jgi:hypothetical protein
MARDRVEDQRTHGKKLLIETVLRFVQEIGKRYPAIEPVIGDK